MLLTSYLGNDILDDMAVSEKRKKYLKKWRLKNLEREKKRQREWQRKWRKENPEEARIKDSIKHKRRKEQECIYARIYARNYKKKVDPLKLATRTILNNAIATGKIKRGKKCEQCDESKVQAHHPDYHYPLKVRWLCSKHHALLHHPVTSPR